MGVPVSIGSKDSCKGQAGRAGADSQRLLFACALWAPFEGRGHSPRLHTQHCWILSTWPQLLEHLSSIAELIAQDTLGIPTGKEGWGCVNCMGCGHVGEDVNGITNGVNIPVTPSRHQSVLGVTGVWRAVQDYFQESTIRVPRGA